MITAEKERTMTFSGRGIGRGYAAGKLRFRHRNVVIGENPRRICGADEEKDKLRHAVGSAITELDELYEKAYDGVGDDEAQIFRIHRMLLEDEDLLSDAESLISDGYTAAYSITKAAEKYGSAFSAIDDDYLSARAADIRDVAMRVCSHLTTGNTEKGNDKGIPDEKYILVADDLTPGETVQLDRSMILGFVTFGGSPNSHTAILARAMGIPALIGTGHLPDYADGKFAVIDADKGLLYLDPDDTLLEKYKPSETTVKVFPKGTPAVTKSGKTVKIYANIGDVSEVDAALSNDAEGIGLVRTEFQFLKKAECPTEDELFEEYSSILKKVGDKPVIIRTLDIGADKKVSYISPENEENPAMGLRGVRLTLAYPDIFKLQIAALYRASIYGNLHIMLPMIVSSDEIDRCKNIIEEVKNDLRQRDIPFDNNVKLGIMIETPASAITSDELAKHCDFFSIGTNDLTQYTLAADRQNPLVSDICDNNTEPVLKLMEIAVANAHKNGIWAGICGEIAADERYTQRFCNMEIDELSVSSPYIMTIKKTVTDCT